MTSPTEPQIVAQPLSHARPNPDWVLLPLRDCAVLTLLARGLGYIAGRGAAGGRGRRGAEHIRTISAKLDLAPAETADRRITAVLRHLEGNHDAS